MLHLQSKKCTLFIAMFLVAGVELEGHTTSQWVQGLMINADSMQTPESSWINRVLSCIAC